MRILTCLVALLMSTLCFTSITLAANEAKIAIDWAWNGTDTTLEGFRFYLDDSVVCEANSPELRTAECVVSLENGGHLFTMTAYGGDWETVKSPEYRFEYLYVKHDSDSRPAPIFIIRIN